MLLELDEMERAARAEAEPNRVPPSQAAPAGEPRVVSRPTGTGGASALGRLALGRVKGDSDALGRAAFVLGLTDEAPNGA